MKLLFATLATLAAAGGSWIAQARGPERDAPAAGRYLEARSASVMGGACHINGEYDHQGAEALVAWSFEAGRVGGVELEGARAVASVSSAENLEAGADRRASVWIDAPDEARRAAVRTWLVAEQSEALGRVESWHTGPLVLDFEGDSYRVEVPGIARVEGSALADRGCCTMPSRVWYSPLAAVDRPVVGNSTVCGFEGDRSSAAWSYQGQNNGFVARFGAAPSL